MLDTAGTVVIRAPQISFASLSGIDLVSFFDDLRKHLGRVIPLCKPLQHQCKADSKFCIKIYIGAYCICN